MKPDAMRVDPAIAAQTNRTCDHEIVVTGGAPASAVAAHKEKQINKEKRQRKTRHHVQHKLENVEAIVFRSQTPESATMQGEPA